MTSITDHTIQPIEVTSSRSPPNGNNAAGSGPQGQLDANKAKELARIFEAVAQHPDVPPAAREIATFLVNDLRGFHKVGNLERYRNVIMADIGRLMTILQRPL